MPNLSLWPLLEELSIRDKGAQIVKLDRNAPFAWAQREFVAEVERQYNAGLPVRIIVLKGRQLGISTITEAILFIWSFLHPNSYSLVLSKQKEDSEYLYNMTRRYWDDGPFFDLFDTKYYTKNDIVWQDPPASTIRIATATKTEVGRGMTIQGCHCSEVAFWGDRVDSIIPGLDNAIPNDHGTIWIHESTAQGVGGYFHDTWMAATDPEGSRSDFTPMFFPWFWHDEYEIPGHNMRYQDLDDDERAVVELLVNNGVDPKRVLGKMAWRRRKIAGGTKGLDGFHEEYPCTPDEAFLSTGSNVFPLMDLANCYKPDVGSDRGFLFNNNGKLEFNRNPSGHLTVFKTPDAKKRQRYAVAVDPTRTIEGDPACIQVMNRATLEQVAVWHGSADPTTIGEIALAISYWYNDALANTEIQGGGRTVLDVWRAAGYKNIWTDRRPDKVRRSGAVLGWNTTYETKQWLLTTLQGSLVRHDVTIHHAGTYYEMTQYIGFGDGTFGPARRSGHDDCVMSFGIVLMTCLTEWSSLNMAEVMGVGGSGEPGIGDHRLRFQGQGTPVNTIPGITIDRGEQVYYGPDEIETWL